MLKSDLSSEHTQFQSFKEITETVLADQNEEISKEITGTIAFEITNVFEELDQQLLMKKRLSILMRGCTSLINGCDSLVNEVVLNPVLKQVRHVFSLQSQ